MTQITAPLPDGWNWCGACGSQSRKLTEAECADLIGWANGSLAIGRSAVDVLEALAWPMEMFHRGTVCSCQPDDGLGSEPDSGYHVYKLFGADGRLLYVGMSRRLRSRLRRHYAERAGYVLSHEVIPCPTERDMVELELHLISTLHPPLNATDNGGD